MNPDTRQPKNNLLDLRQKPKKQLPNKKNIFKKQNVIILTVTLLVILSVAFFMYITQKKEDLNSPTVIKNRISKHLVLPKDEEPALATVTNKEQVGTPFLRQAENGDKMLIYQNAKKVILYRPSIDRIIDVGPVSIAEPASPE